MQSEWMGGKPAGCVAVNPNNYIQVLFAKSTKMKSGNFNIAKYKNIEDAMTVAKEYQMTISDQLELTKNKYRYITDPDGSRYLEVQLQKDLIMKCEVEHLPQVEERVWTANKAKDKYTYYVKSRDSVKREQEYCLFHRHVYPEITEIDHINREGLDNRRCNVRDGSTGFNPNNKRKQKNNISGTVGVYLEGKDGPKPRYRAQWVDINGKKCNKSFATSRACIQREQEYCLFHRRVYPNFTVIDHINKDGLDNRQSNIRDGSNCINKKKGKNNTSGCVGVIPVYSKTGDDIVSYKASFTDINSKRTNKSFSCATWGEEAFNKACEWREDKQREKIEDISA